MAKPGRKKRRQVSEAAARLGRLGGPARAKALTPERRREIAKKAIEARWAKAAREKKGGPR